MKPANEAIKTAIIESALPNVPFDGWTRACLENAALEAGYSKDMVKSVFPQGEKDALIHFSYWADSQMLRSLEKRSPAPARIRDKVTAAVQARLDVLAPHKEAERLAISYWMRPMRKFEAAKLVWKTADVIWNWAGDTATDYNRYTKRTLLSGVLTTTMLCWLHDTSDGHAETRSFLDRRIDNVLSIGKIVGRFKTA